MAESAGLKIATNTHGANNAPRHTPNERLAIQQRRQRVADRYVRGETQRAIANDLRVSQTTVCTDLKAIQAEWLKSSLRDFDKLRARELAKVDALELTLWHSWECSRSARAARSPKAPAKGAGNPKFAEVILLCIARRCKLLGIDAPESHHITGPAFKIYNTEENFNPDAA